MPEFPEQAPPLEQEMDLIEDCLLSFSSSLPCFDHKKMFDHATTVFNGVVSNDNNDKTNMMKSRVVSLFFRQLSSRLSLSKNQNNHLVRFMKNMLVFVSPESGEISRKILQAMTPAEDNQSRTLTESTCSARRIWTSVCF